MKIEYIDITENKDSTTYRVRVPYHENGKRKYISKSFCSGDFGSKKVALEQAKLFRDRTKLEVHQMSYSSSSSTLQDIFELMLNSYPCSAETKRKYRNTYNKYIAPRIAPNRKFKDISLNDIQESLNVLQNDKTDEIIKKTFSCWKRLYDYALKNDIVHKDLTRLVTRPKSRIVHKKRSMDCSKDELLEIIDKLEHSSVRDKVLIIKALKIMYYVGIRPAECFALEEDCIDRKNRTISIHQAISHDSNRKPYISITKTGNAIRTLPYTEDLDEVFEDFNGFKKANGELFDSSYVSQIVNKVSNGQFRMYKLRHLFATDFIEQGVDLRTLQELMGHNDSSMTLSYARSNEEKHRIAMSIKR